MPHLIPCPKCLRTGYTRLEHIISGRASSRAFYCGVCEHTWLVEETPKPPVIKYPAPLKPKVRRFGPKR